MSACVFSRQSLTASCPLPDSMRLPFCDCNLKVYSTKFAKKLPLGGSVKITKRAWCFFLFFAYFFQNEHFVFVAKV